VSALKGCPVNSSPAGVLASCSGTNQVTITAGGTEWIRQGVAFSLNGGANTYYVQSFNAGTGVITAAVTNPATTFPTATGIQIGQGISSGIVGVSATGTSGTNTAVLNSTDGIFLNLPIYFFGDTAGPHAVTAIDQSTRTVTFTNNLTTNLSSACVMSIGGDDGLDISSVRHAVVSFCNFRHFGDAALRMQSNVAFYGSRSTSDVNGGANTSQIYVTYCNFYNIYQTSTTTNNFTMGGGRDMYMMYNTFESLRGSVKFAGRVPGSRNINIIGNVITSSDNHGVECDSQSDLRIMGNQVYNVFNQGVFCTVNNGPTNVTGTVTATTAGSPIVTMSTTSFCKVAGQISIAGANGPFTILSVDSGTQITLATNCDVTISTPSAYGIVGLGVTGFAISGLKIKDNVFDNCGQIGTASAIRLQSDGYLDGYRFDYKDVTITGNTIRNVTNTANIGINLSLGSYVGLEIDKNKFLDYQGVAAIKYLGRGSTTVGFINGIRIRDNEIQLNNASANGIWVETNGSTTQQLNDVSLMNNCITGTYSKQYVVGNLNNTRITNRTNSTLIPQGQVFFNSAPMKNFTIDGKYQLTKTTSGTTPASLLFDNTTATAKILLNPNQAMGFNAKITGRDTSGNCGSYTLTGLIKQGANAAATALVGSPAFTALFEDTAGWSVAATADTTNGALDLTATGTTGAVIHWVAVVDTVEIT
jgi:putative cofactor-binding repeat protein